MFYLSRVFPCFTFLRCFHFSTFSGVFIFTFLGCFHVSLFSDDFIFRLSQVFHFSPFSGVFVLLYLDRYRFGRAFFTFRHFFTVHSFLTFGTTCFYQGFPGGSSSSLKIAGPPSEFRNTDRAHLFV